MLDLVAILIYTKLTQPNALYEEDCFSCIFKERFFLNYLSYSFVDDEIIIYLIHKTHLVCFTIRNAKVS